MKTHVTLLCSIALVLCGSYECLSQYNDIHDFTCSTDGCFKQGNPLGPEVFAQGRDGNLYGTMTGGGANNLGTFFRATPDGSVTALYNFDSNVVATGITDGYTPVSGVTLGWTDGNLYGTTLQGGTGGIHAGTIFKMTPTGTIAFLYNFKGAGGTTCPSTNKPDGGSPYAPPIQGTDNRFYGVTSQGTAYSIGASGGFKALCSLVSPSVLIPFGAFAPLLQASNGQFYGTATSLNGYVFRFSSNGAAAIVYNFNSTGGASGRTPDGPVIQGTDGKLYGTTASDWTRDSGEVFSLTVAGSISNPMLHPFDRYNNNAVYGYSPTAGLLQATDGNFYGSTQYGGDPLCNCGVLFKITNKGVYSVLHTFRGDEPNQPFTTQFQHTNGRIYGLLLRGANNTDGAALYSLDIGASAFVRLRTTSGKAGQVIPIQGYQLTGTTHVKFGTADAASFSVVADGWITAVVPVTGTTGSITVVTPSGTLTSSKPFKVIPTITSINPTSGAVGNQVVVTGTGLTQVSAVTFGGVKATVFTINSATQVTATVPVGAKTGKIVVTTPGGSGGSPVIFTVTS